MGNFKKSVMYSHYTGTQRQNIIDCVWMAKELLKEGNTAEAMLWLDKVSTNVEELTLKIARLDELNEMN
jgi:hypothetical protein